MLKGSSSPAAKHVVRLWCDAHTRYRVPEIHLRQSRFDGLLHDAHCCDVMLLSCYLAFRVQKIFLCILLFAFKSFFVSTAHMSTPSVGCAEADWYARDTF